MQIVCSEFEIKTLSKTVQKRMKWICNENKIICNEKRFIRNENFFHDDVDCGIIRNDVWKWD